MYRMLGYGLAPLKQMCVEQDTTLFFPPCSIGYLSITLFVFPLVDDNTLPQLTPAVPQAGGWDALCVLSWVVDTLGPVVAALVLSSEPHW